ncbi:MAG: beta-propeller fold lactonase family protein [Planctomycetes bacterium]|nr:beta-propeller fold lactonase family protein [Planctomycetota bacterium]
MLKSENACLTKFLIPGRDSREAKMTNRIIVSALASFTLTAAPLTAQQFSQDIPLSGLGNGNSAKPFGIAYEPGLDRIFVAVAGAFGAENNVVAVIDPNTDTVVSTIPVGLYPEEIAFGYDTNGALLYGAVTNSTSGTVTIFDPNLNVRGEVTLPDPFGFGTCYPFGIAWDGGIERFYVSTLDGTGDVHSVNPATLTTSPIAPYNAVSSSGSRLLVHAGRLWNGATRYNASFSNSDSFVVNFKISSKASEEVLIANETRHFYPSVQDIIALPNNDVLVGGLGFNGYLYHFDVNGTLLSTHHLKNASGAHGLAIGPQGRLLAICDLVTDTLVLYDMDERTELSATAMSSIGLGYGQPNNAVFVNKKLYVTSQATEEVVVFNNLPSPPPGSGYAGQLTISNSTPSLGDSVTIEVTGNGLVALAQSREGVKTNYRGLNADIGPQINLLGVSSTTYNESAAVPNNPALRGLRLWYQGAVDLDSTPQPTEPRALIVQ